MKAVLEIVLYFLCCGLVFSWFMLFRCHCAGKWINDLYEIAIREKGRSEWYLTWDVDKAIRSPKHWNKWTSPQWLDYLKKLDKRARG